MERLEYKAQCFVTESRQLLIFHSLSVRTVNFNSSCCGCIKHIQKLIDAKVPIIVMDNSNYKTLKKPVRMEYQYDIDIPEFKEIPTYKRMGVCILKNDHACKYMGFSPTKEEMSKRSQIMEQDVYKRQHYNQLLFLYRKPWIDKQNRIFLFVTLAASKK